MNLKRIFAVAAIGISTAAFGDQSAVQFEVVLTRDGKIVASPKVVGAFGNTVALTQGGVMKFEGSASSPNADGTSMTAVKLYLFENGEMGPPHQMSMLVNLGKESSLAYSVPGTNARFVVVPRLVKLRESKG
jgi:hypothetical protein